MRLSNTFNVGNWLDTHITDIYLDEFLQEDRIDGCLEVQSISVLCHGQELLSTIRRHVDSKTGLLSPGIKLSLGTIPEHLLSELCTALNKHCFSITIPL